jgi:hypothetical protein
VDPGVPAVLGDLPKGATANRLGMAQWLIREEHPLTSRVMINRLWGLFMGDGFVRTAEDFGLQGEMPSHPELLDWMAVDFIQSGWDIKRMVKAIVTSETYCQDPRIPSQHLEKDPLNRLLGRGPRFRLQGEFLRDQALFVSGLYYEKIGGPSVKPYQPPNIWEDVALDTNLSKYVQDKGEKLFRRSMYTYWKRSSPHPTMTTFDAPSREKCTATRPRTNTPLQALITLNEPQFVEAARAFAQRILKEADHLRLSCRALPRTQTGRDHRAGGTCPQAKGTIWRRQKEGGRTAQDRGEPPGWNHRSGRTRVMDDPCQHAVQPGRIPDPQLIRFGGSNEDKDIRYIKGS